MLQAAQRGAERVLVLGNSGIEPERIGDPPHAIGMLMRTVDLMSSQPTTAEVQQAELGAVARRFTEYNVCSTRLQLAAAASADVSPATLSANINTFCARKGPGFLPANPTPRPRGLRALAGALALRAGGHELALVLGLPARARPAPTCEGSHFRRS